MTRMTTVAASADAGAGSRRAARFTARHWLWDRSALGRVQKCGRCSRDASGVTVRVSTAADGSRSAGFAGVSTCGSVWSCPVCSAKIAAGRQDEIMRALTEWHRRGGRVGLVTLTMHHVRGQSLVDLWDAVSDAWQAVTSGAGWKADQLLHGVPMARVVRTGRRAGQTVTVPRIRTIRVVEVTHGQNGWHVHVHALVLVDGRASAGVVGQIGAAMFGRWSRSLVASGFQAPSFRRGLDARRLEGDPAAALGEYFTKAVYAAALETSRADLKDAKRGNSTPFGILRSLVTTGEDGARALTEAEALRAAAVWAEWETGSKGRRQVTWTVGLRAELLGDEPELSDEELAEADAGGDDEHKVQPATWAAIARARADWAVLQAFMVSADDGRALVAIFDARAEAHEARRLVGVDRLALPRPDWRRRR